MSFFRNILIAEDEPSIRHVLTLVLSEKGYNVRAVADGAEALEELAARSYDAVICDVRMPNVTGLELLERALPQWPGLTFLVMSAYGSPEAALEAVGRGAYDYVLKPFKPEEMVLALKKAEERHRLLRENRRLRQLQTGAEPLDKMLGVSNAIRDLKRQVQRLAPVSTTVLVTGESGTGKELVARALHDLSPRAGMPFVAVNCGAIPAGLIESELFGHAKGAFTDARAARRGLFSEADGGTLLLDEIGELPPAAQVKLLRFLQEGEIRAVGEDRVDKVDVRVVAATHRDLGKLVKQGGFREDLFYRLNVVNLRVPPLRERSEDVIVLARSFLERFDREMDRVPGVRGFSQEAEALLRGHSWPGNIRELENAVERAVLLTEEEWVSPKNLPDQLRGSVERGPETAAPSTTAVTTPEDLSLKRAVKQLESEYICAALRRTRGNRTRAAELLDISQRALLYKIKEYGIDPDAEGDKPLPKGLG